MHQLFILNQPLIKQNGTVTKTLDALCYALDCEVQDIIKFVKE